MNLLLLCVHQAVVLLAATGLTKACRERGKSYLETFGIGISVSLFFALISACQALVGYRCVENSDSFSGNCEEHAEVSRPPSDAFTGVLMGTVPMGLLSLALRKRWEERREKGISE